MRQFTTHTLNQVWLASARLERNGRCAFLIVIVGKQHARCRIATGFTNVGLITKGVGLRGRMDLYSPWQGYDNAHHFSENDDNLPCVMFMPLVTHNVSPFV